MLAKVILNRTTCVDQPSKNSAKIMSDYIINNCDGINLDQSPEESIYDLITNHWAVFQTENRYFHLYLVGKYSKFERAKMMDSFFFC